MNRITSYNVCYTKLLRSLILGFESLEPEKPSGPQEGSESGAKESTGNPGCVITSYSIHYTKLYELPSIRVTRGAILTSSPRFISSTSFLITWGKAIPVGSIITISGLYSFVRRSIVVLSPTFREQQMQPLVIVITSYSIHYTKLYDILCGNFCVFRPKCVYCFLFSFSLFSFLPDAFSIIFSPLALFEAKEQEIARTRFFVLINKGRMGRKPIPRNNFV